MTERRERGAQQEGRNARNPNLTQVDLRTWICDRVRCRVFNGTREESKVEGWGPPAQLALASRAEKKHVPGTRSFDVSVEPRATEFVYQPAAIVGILAREQPERLCRACNRGDRDRRSARLIYKFCPLATEPRKLAPKPVARFARGFIDLQIGNSASSRFTLYGDPEVG